MFIIKIIICFLILSQLPIMAEMVEQKREKQREKSNTSESVLEKFDDNHLNDSKDIEPPYYWLDLSLELIQFFFQYNSATHLSFQPYPYHQGNPGYIVQNKDRVKRNLGYFSVQHRWVESYVHAIDTDIKLHFHQQVGLNLNFQFYTEKRLKQDDQLSTFRVSLFRNLLLKPNFIVDMNTGLRFIDAYRGIDFGWHIILFPAYPFTLNLDLIGGNVEDVFFSEINIAAGAMMNRFELMLGYRTISWGSQTLNGPYLGGRLWL